MHVENATAFAIIGCVGVAVLALTRRWWITRRDRVSVPSCGAFRHPLHDTLTWSCPKCSADFRVVGIQTPRLRTALPIRFMERAVMWTCVSTALLAALSLVLALVPGAREITFTRHHVLHSEAGMFNRLVVDSLVKDRDGRRGDIWVTLAVQDATFQGSPLTAQFGTTNKWSYAGAGTPTPLVLMQSPEQLSSERIQRWLEVGGISCNSPVKVTEVEELFSLINAIRVDPVSTDVALRHLRSVASSQEQSSGPRMSYQLASLALPMCVWIGGLVHARRSTFNRAREQPRKVTAASL
ncbi:MAG: hypothetical protein H7210_10430 [Pyrinomonadaceae bacterium]|nr:hypothetical protein [Phycisphaerales bacterium]